MQIHHYDTAGPGAVLQNGALEFTVGQVLETPVNGQAKIIAWHRLPDQFDLLHGPPKPVLDHTFAACRALQPVVVGQFQSLLANVINICESDHVRSDLAGRIKAPVFLLQENSGNIQGLDLCGDIRMKATT